MCAMCANDIECAERKVNIMGNARRCLMDCRAERHRRRERGYSLLIRMDRKSNEMIQK